MKSCFISGKHICRSLGFSFLLWFIFSFGICTAQTVDGQDSTDLMSLSLEELLNVKINIASKHEEKESEAPGIVYVLTRDDLSRFGNLSLISILNRVPGLISSGVSFSDITTVATWGDQVKRTSGHILFLLNGRPVREVMEGGVSSDILNVFPVNVIERIEIVKGTGSVLYGTDAFSAVVNIITLDTGRKHFSLGPVITSGWGFGVTAETAFSLGEANVLFGGRYIQKPEWTPSFLSTSPLTLNDTIYTSVIPHKGPGLFLEMNYKGLTFMSQYNNFWSNSMENQGQRWTKFFNNIGYRKEIGRFWTIEMNIDITHATLNSREVLTRASDNIIGEWTNVFTINKNSTLVVGSLISRIDGREVLLMPGMEGVVSCDGVKENYAMYAQLEYMVFKSLKVISGVQVNKPQGIKTDMVPRVGLIWNPSDNLTLKAIYGEAFRAPSISELYLQSPHTKGNPDLRPERVADIELGLSYRKGNTFWGLNAFQSKQSGIIARVDEIYQNLEEIEFIGIEAETKYYLSKSLFFTASAMLQSNRNDTAQYITPVAGFGAKGGISYSGRRGLRVSIFNIYQGALDSKFSWIYEPEEMAYNLTSLNCEYKLSSSMDEDTGLSFFLRIDNVFDNKYLRYDQRGVVTPANAGREFFVGMNLLL